MGINSSQSFTAKPPRILEPYHPSTYWHEVTFRNDLNFDHDAVKSSAEAAPLYLEGFKQADRPPYPPRLLVDPMTNLPALLKGYLTAGSPDTSIAKPPTEPSEFAESAERWVRDPLVSRVTFGLSSDELFIPPGKGLPARLKREAWLRSSMPAKEFAKTEKMVTDSTFRRTEAYHLYYQQWQDGRWPVYGGQIALHGGLNSALVALSSSYLPLVNGAKFVPRIAPKDAFEIATAAFRMEIKGFNADTWQVVLVPYAGSEQFIFPFWDRFWLAYCLEAHTTSGDDAWRVFVDAQNGDGLVLGHIERLVSQVNAYYLETSSSACQHPPALSEHANLTLTQLRTSLDPYLEHLVDATGTVLDMTSFPAPPFEPPVNLQVESSNIAFHTWRTLDYFVSTCGADETQLRGYDYEYVELQGFGFETQCVAVKNHQTPPLRLIIGIDMQGTLDMGFNPASGKNPKRITFQTLSEPPPPLEGPSIHNPSLDPEVIQHEVAHAIMWLLHSSPFDEPSATVPFTRALLEGYASYFARSLAGRHSNDAQGNPHRLWASAVYRVEVWDKEWSFVRDILVVGADKLTAPNVYPLDVTSGLPVYKLGMVWARALWDIRALLSENTVFGPPGLDLADQLALDGYYYCHGLIENFQVAAEGVLHSAAQKGLNAPIVQQMRNKFVVRGICAA